jgi:hypothetical protein
MDIIENQIIPTYYNNKTEWARLMRQAIRTSEAYFNSDRMVIEYYNRLYNPIAHDDCQAGEKKKELVSRGVSRITDIDEEYIYFWGKKFFYRVKTDGSSLECLSKNKLNHPCPNEVCSTVCVFDDMLFYSKGFKGKMIKRIRLTTNYVCKTLKQNLKKHC